MSGNNRCAYVPREIPVCLWSGCFKQLLFEGQKVNISEKNLHEEGRAQASLLLANLLQVLKSFEWKILLMVTLPPVTVVLVLAGPLVISSSQGHMETISQSHSHLSANVQLAK